MARDKENYNSSFGLVIEYHCNDNDIDITSDKFIETIQAYCQVANAQYYSILHDRDINANGEVKRKHYHLILVHKSRIDKSTLIKRIAERLGITPNCISCDAVYTLNGAIRYLMHMDDSDKASYLPFEVSTNNETIFNLAINNQCDNVDINYLIQLCRDLPKLKVMEVLGLEVYQRWRNTISDIYKEL